MKLLILTPYVPYPINSGGNLYFFGLVDRIRKHVDVSLILIVRHSQMKDVERLQKIWDNVTFHLFYNDTIADTPLPTKYKWMDSVSKSFERKVNRKRSSLSSDLVKKLSVASYNNSVFYKPLSSAYIEFVDSVIKSHSFDLVQVDFFELIDVVDILPVELKKLFIHHELRFVRNECEFNLFANPTASDRYMLNYSKVYELGHLMKYDGVASLTDVDKCKLESEGIPSSQIYVSPAIVDVQTSGISDEYEFNNKIVYLGGSDHFPNYDAVDWFLSNCWSKIHEDNPFLEFHVIGSWKTKLARQYESIHPGVKFRGFVDDLRVELANAIMIVPLRIGSGVRMKILEAISLGCPIISTRIGAEGVGLIANQDVLYGDTPIELVEAIEQLSSNNSLCRQIRQSSYSKLLARPTPDDLARVRLEIYKDILDK